MDSQKVHQSVPPLAGLEWGPRLRRGTDSLRSFGPSTKLRVVSLPNHKLRTVSLSNPHDGERENEVKNEYIMTALNKAQKYYLRGNK